MCPGSQCEWQGQPSSVFSIFFPSGVCAFACGFLEGGSGRQASEPWTGTRDPRLQAWTCPVVCAALGCYCPRWAPFVLYLNDPHSWPLPTGPRAPDTHSGPHTPQSPGARWTGRMCEVSRGRMAGRGEDCGQSETCPAWRHSK